MNLVTDSRPSDALSNAEVVMYLFQAIRAQELKTVNQVREECARQFPDMTPDRQSQCLSDLARAMNSGNDAPARRPHARR